MSEEITLADCQELVRVTRNGHVESRHLGIAVVLAPDGTTRFALGNPDAWIFPRSALKPFQALGSLSSGAELTAEQLAIACASHSGTDAHQALAAQILDAVGLSPAALGCPAAWPADSATRSALTASGGGPSSLAFNCSGKHAAFLAAAVALDESTSNYLDPEHPVQRAALAAIKRWCGPLGAIGVDGCGAPAPMLQLISLARGFSALAADEDPQLEAVREAMLSHPWAVQGEHRANSVVMRETGVLAKLGAEGVLAMAAPDGTSVALKMLDGSQRGTDELALSLLVRAGALEPASLERLRPLLRPEAKTAGARAAGLEIATVNF
ncbi:asparaginase [Glutamicibacter sp. PS]|uniref:asparaginase n=1 Tax=Glutamicibacter sp. PS TaxID=3075634 RepID=UPI00283F4C31|nr:asparaginase [Glutamicibacter sp. PS]MDR4532048.1 asparaginase [Glutamicibacter sp. PS]